MKKKIYFVATVYDPIYIFLKPYLNSLSKEYEVSIICNLKNNSFPKFNKFEYINLYILRKPNILIDVSTFITLLILFLSKRPYKLISITPKAGFFCTILSKLLLIKNLHFVTGQIWENKTNIFKRSFLKTIDKFICRASDKIIVDSRPQYKYLLNQKIINDNAVYFNSVSGIDSSKFFKNLNYKYQFKSKFRLTNNSFGLIYVGRVNRDKGIKNLLKIYENIKKILKNNIFLVIVGEDEINLFKKISNSYLRKNNIFYFKKTDDINYYLNVCDLFVTCSNREGFCQSIIEANALGLPAIAYKLYNLNETIIDTKTGYLVENDYSFKKKILFLYNNKIQYKKFSNNCIRRNRFKYDTKNFINKFNFFLFNND